MIRSRQPDAPEPDSSQENPAPTGWSRLAHAYDWQLPLERVALAAAVELADPRPDDVVLDLGTGTAGLLRALARQPGRPRVAIGVDECPAMLERAAALPTGWSLRVADARRLPYADRSFSVVTAAYLLHVVDAEARRQIVSEAHRVLLPGGRFVVVTPGWPRTRLGRMLYSPLAAACGSCPGPRGAFRRLDPRPDLAAASFAIRASRLVGRGYPSICVLGARAAGRDPTVAA